MPRVWIEVIIVFWNEGVKEELDFGLAKSYLNFDSLLEKDGASRILL